MGCSNNGEDKIKGEIIYCYGDGSVYVGPMLNSRPHGIGTKYYEDGRIEHGQWYHGQINGEREVAQYKDGIAIFGRKPDYQFVGNLKAYFQDGEEYRIVKQKSGSEQIFKKMNYEKNIDEGDHSSLKNFIQGNEKVSHVPPQVIKGKKRLYYLKKKAGGGGFGVVFCYEAESSFKGLRRPFAVKYDPKENSQANQFKILNQLKKHPHKNVVMFEEATSQSGHNYLIMQYCQGNLNHIIPHLNNKMFVLFQMYELCKGVEHMHQKACYHRDIKASNILVTFLSSQIYWLITLKFCDFGISQSIQDSKPSTNLVEFGTKNYNPPERGDGSVEDLKKLDGSKSDIWSLGLVFIQMMSSKLLRDAAVTIRVRSQDGSKRLKQQILKHLKEQYKTPQILNLLTKMLKHDPRRRITIAEVKNIILSLPEFVSQSKSRKQVQLQRELKMVEIQKDLIEEKIKDKQVQNQELKETLKRQQQKLRKAYDQLEQTKKLVQDKNKVQNEKKKLYEKVKNMEAKMLEMQKKGEQLKKQIQLLQNKESRPTQPIPEKDSVKTKLDQQQARQRNLQEKVVQCAKKDNRNGVITSWNDFEKNQVLWLQYCGIDELPQKLCMLTQLKQLGLWENKLSLLPDNFGCLMHLVVLHLQSNQLISLPESIGSLVKLQRFHLHNNKLKSLPKSFGNLKQLVKISLDLAVVPKPNTFSNSHSPFSKINKLQTLYIYYTSQETKDLLKLEQECQQRKVVLFKNI